MKNVLCSSLVHFKKRLSIFPVPSRDVTYQTFPGGEWFLLFPARESLVSDIPAGDGKIVNLFLQCIVNVASGLENLGKKKLEHR